MERRGFTLFTCSCTAALAALIADPASAEQKKSKELAPSIVSANPSPQRSQQPAKKPAVPTATEWRPEASHATTKHVLSESKAAAPKARRPFKVHKKHAPKAVVQPRQDLTHHGLLEDAQRYDPRLNHQTAGVQNPQTPDLTHDHFQELDRNLDGRVDPVERAFGRLDMDRDLHNRHPQ